MMINERDASHNQMIIANEMIAKINRILLSAQVRFLNFNPNMGKFATISQQSTGIVRYRKTGLVTSWSSPKDL